MLGRSQKTSKKSAAIGGLGLLGFLALACGCTSQPGWLKKDTSDKDQTDASPQPQPDPDGDAVIPVPIALLAGNFLEQFKIDLGGSATGEITSIGRDAAAATSISSVLAPSFKHLRDLQDALFGEAGVFAGKPLTATKGRVHRYKLDGVKFRWPTKAPYALEIKDAPAGDKYPIAIDVLCQRTGSAELEICLHYGVLLKDGAQASLQVRFFDEDDEPNPMYIFDVAYDTDGKSLEGQLGEQPRTYLDCARSAFRVEASADGSRLDLGDVRFYAADSIGVWGVPFGEYPTTGDIVLDRYRIAPTAGVAVSDEAFFPAAEAAKLTEPLPVDVFATHGITKLLNEAIVQFVRGVEVTPACNTLGDVFATAGTKAGTPARLPPNICQDQGALTDAQVFAYITAFCDAGNDVTLTGDLGKIAAMVGGTCPLFKLIPTLGPDRRYIDYNGGTRQVTSDPAAAPAAAKALADEVATLGFPLKVGYWRDQPLPTLTKVPVADFADAKAP